MTLAEAFRGWRRRRDLRIWSRRGFPATVERKYWSEREYRRDAAGLATSGYDEVTESAANTQDAAGVAATRDDNVYLGRGGRLGPFAAGVPSGPLLRVAYRRRTLPPAN